jgi:hypothetical protein
MADTKKSTSKKKAAAAKKATAKKATTQKKVAAKATAAPATAGTKKKAVKQKAMSKGSPTEVSSEARWQMIAEAAYHKAEKRGFMGDPVDDWLAAEAEIDAALNWQK